MQQSVESPVGLLGGGGGGGKCVIVTNAHP